MAVLLKVNERAVRPRSLKKQLREEGIIPAVVYGNGMTTTPISIDEKELMKAIKENGQNAVYTLDINGTKTPTLIFDQQQETFNRRWLHVEFLAVDMSEKTELEAEVLLTGTPKGVKVGGSLGQNLYTVLVSATPDNIPDVIEVDVSELEIGDAITLGDLPKNDKYDIVMDMEEQIAIVEEPRVHEEEETDGVAAAPEVIGEKE